MTARWRRSPAASWPGCARPQACAPRPAQALTSVARERYSWEGVARSVAAAAQGRLAELAPIA